MLKFKTRLLYWSITLLFVIPALILLLAILVPSERFREGAANIASDLCDWRYWVVHDFYLNRSRGFSLTIKG
jgi:uncharacterized membrane protein